MTVVYNDTHTWAVLTVDCWFMVTPCQRLWINSNDLLSNVNILEAIAFSALTLLAGHQQEHPACKNEWWGAGMVISLEQGAKWFQCGPADATANPCWISRHQKRKNRSGLQYLVTAYPDCPAKDRRLFVCNGNWPRAGDHISIWQDTDDWWRWLW